MIFRRRKGRSASLDRLRKIDAVGYRVADDGRVVCKSCGAWCGQCGDDYSASSVEEFERKMQERNRPSG